MVIWNLLTCSLSSPSFRWSPQTLKKNHKNSLIMNKITVEHNLKHLSCCSSGENWYTMGLRLIPVIFFPFFFLSFSNANDTSTMLKLRASLSPSPSSSWRSSNSYCRWSGIQCDASSRVTSIDISSKSLSGTLPSNLNSLSHLTNFSIQNNNFNGPIPLLSNLNFLKQIHLDSNSFSSIPADAFQNLPSLQTLTLNHNPSLSPWEFPDLASSPNLTVFEAISTSMIGSFPSLFWTPNLQILRLSHNQLTGTIWQEPSSYNLQLQTLWLDHQEMGLSGSLDFLVTMTQLTQVWLNDNSFNGTIPDLSNCTKIFDLQLNDNQLLGIVPSSLSSLPNLLNISLQNNNLFGPYPNFSKKVKVEIGHTSNFCSDKPGAPCDKQVVALLDVMEALGYPSNLMDAWRGKNACKWKFIGCNKNGSVTSVNLASQQFEGYIPTALGNLTALHSLYLNDNAFFGGIPQSFTLLPQLKVLDVSRNYLTGMMPKFQSSVRVNVTGNMLVANESIFKAASSSIEDFENTSSGSNFTSLTHSGSILGMKVKTFITVCVAFSTLVVFTISTMLWLLSKRYKKRRHENEWEDDSGEQLGGLLRRFSYKNLKSATGNFDPKRKLGGGGFGSVYEGMLVNGTKIAVKRLDRLGQGSKEFVAEVKTLGSIHHFNLVKLIGFCDEKVYRLLVYEHMSNGSLDKWIFNKQEQKESTLLSWNTRKKIILQIAKGLAYLHEECQHRIAHLDIKPQNILLDENFNAKVADFGLAKLIDREESFVMTQMRGTRGYLAPEWLSRRITEKADVYSFGIVLLEVVYERRNLEYSTYDDDEEESNNCLLVHLVKKKAEMNRLLELIEGYYQEMDGNGEEVEKIVKIGICCLHEDPTRRPTMSNVVKELEGEMNMLVMELESTYSTTSFNSSSSRQGNSSTVSASVLSGPR